MKRFLTLTYAILLCSASYGQEDVISNLKGNWSTTQQSFYQTLEVCNAYTYQLGDHGNGRLAITVNFQNREMKQVPPTYQIHFLFNYTLQEAEERGKFLLQINYLDYYNWYDDNPSVLVTDLPANYKRYLDLLRDKFEHQQYDYQLEIVNGNWIRLQSDSIEGLNKELLLKKLGRRVSCEQFQQN